MILRLLHLLGLEGPGGKSRGEEQVLVTQPLAEDRLELVQSRKKLRSTCGTRTSTRSARRQRLPAATAQRLEAGHDEALPRDAQQLGDGLDRAHEMFENLGGDDVESVVANGRRASRA